MALLPFGSPPTPDSTTTKKGKIKLAGDLTGTADLPTIKTSVALGGSPTTTTQTAGDSSTKIATTAYVDNVQRQPSGRLCLTSGEPVANTAKNAKTVVYFTPYKGNTISLYDGSLWQTIAFTEKSISLASATADSNYDIFGYLNAGALALEKLIWTDGTTRATALAWQDGMYVKSGDATRLYLGTIRITDTTGQTAMNATHMYVWNYFNRVVYTLTITDNASHTYQSATPRQWNANTANQANAVIGVLEDTINVGWVAQIASGIAGANASVRMTLDSYTTVVAIIGGGGATNMSVDTSKIGNAGTIKHQTIITPGYHYFALTEQSTNTNLATFASVVGTVGIMG